MARLRLRSIICCFVFVSFSANTLADADVYETFTDPAQAGECFALQGEYEGTIDTSAGNEQYATQIIALGRGEFRLISFRGGLPGSGWDQSDKITMDGRLKGAAVVFKSPEHFVRAVLRDGKLTVVDADGKTLGVLKKLVRKSPTLGLKPPRDAVVLFDGTTAENFENARIVDGGLLAEGTFSKQKFGDHRLHLEFRTPLMPTARGQARGNSGCYLQGRYEVQILDSFGLEAADNECGGLYQASAPMLNMCLPPLSWQTYDIDFTAPRYENGRKIANARISVRHNGVLIHDDVELSGDTPGGLSTECPGPGPLFLQNHRNPVRFRNIWVLSKD